MRYLTIVCSILYVLFVATNALAAAGEIVATVNDKSITSHELQNRKKMLAYLNNIGNLTKEQDRTLTTQVLDNLIDEEVLMQRADSYGVKVTDSELENAIAEIEARNKMPRGGLCTSLKNHGINPETFRTKIKFELLMSKFTGDMAKDVTVSNNEVESAIVDSNARDAVISLQIIKSTNRDNKTFTQMQELSKKMRGCDDNGKLYRGVADVSVIDTNLSRLEPQVQRAIKDITTGQHTDVLKFDDSFTIFAVCKRTIDNFTDIDSKYVAQALGNKKLSIKSKKHLRDWRRKAYIKVYI